LDEGGRFLDLSNRHTSIKNLIQGGGSYITKASVFRDHASIDLWKYNID